jgi:hypothetical protein
MLEPNVACANSVMAKRNSVSSSVSSSRYAKMSSCYAETVVIILCADAQITKSRLPKINLYSFSLYEACMLPGISHMRYIAAG